MATLAHQRAGGLGRSADWGTSARAVLERAVADAPSHVPPPTGWLRHLFARDQSAAALIRRYRLWPAIEHAYERVTREFGPVRVEVTAEDSYGTEFLMVIFLCESLDFDRMIDQSFEIAEVCRELVGERDWYRLVISVEPDPEMDAR